MNQLQTKVTSTEMIFSSDNIESMKEMAKLMSQSAIQLPDHFKGKPADCLAVVMQAAQWGLNPFTVAQKTHIINGTLGYEAQLVNAVVSKSSAITGRFKYEFKGTDAEWKPQMKKVNRNGKDAWVPEFNQNAAVKCGAIIAGDDEITWGEWIYPANQSVFNSPLWRTNPKQQAGYLACKFWARFYTPDVILGAYTTDEVHEQQERDITPPADAQAPKSGIAAALESKAE